MDKTLRWIRMGVAVWAGMALAGCCVMPWGYGHHYGGDDRGGYRGGERGGRGGER